MAAKAVSTGVLVVVVAVAVLVGSASAQSGSGCTQAVISLSPCLNYITGNQTAPSGSCCSRLALLATSQPECLCVVITGDIFSELGFDVIKTQTLHLPDACCIKTPPCGSDVRTQTPATSAATATESGTESTPRTRTNDSKLHGSAGFIVDPAVHAASDQ